MTLVNSLSFEVLFVFSVKHQPNFFLVVRIFISATLTPFCAYQFRDTRNPKVPEDSLETFRFPKKEMLLLGTEISKPTNSRSQIKRTIFQWVIRWNGEKGHSYPPPYFPDSCILATHLLWFKTFIAPYRIPLQHCKMLSSRCQSNWPFSRPFLCPISQLLLNHGTWRLRVCRAPLSKRKQNWQKAAEYVRHGSFSGPLILSFHSVLIPRVSAIILSPRSCHKSPDLVLSMFLTSFLPLPISYCRSVSHTISS